MLSARRVSLCFVLAALSAQAAQRPRTVIDNPDANTVVKLEFGLTAGEPRRWSGRACVSAGKILAERRGLAPRPPDAAKRANGLVEPDLGRVPLSRKRPAETKFQGRSPQ